MQDAGVPAGSSRWAWLLPAAAGLLALAPAFFWSGTLLCEEVPGLLRKNWAERGFLQKTFDPRGWDFYQGRELSYAIDFLDAQWTRALLRRDVLLLVPPSGIAASLAFVAVGLWLAPRALPRLGRTGRWLVLLVLLSNFVVQSSMGVLYRATKPLVAPLLLVLLLLALAERRQPRLAARTAFAAVFSLGLTLGLLDRQGLFYVAALALVLCVLWLRTRRGLALASGAFAAVVTWLAYFYLLGPWLIERLNGYAPSMRFQRLRPARLLQAAPWRQGVDVLADWTSVLVGGLPKWFLAAAFLVGFILWANRNRTRPGRLLWVTGCLVAAAAAQLAMVAMMIERHPPVTWIGNRLWYYPLPFEAVLVFFGLWALDIAAARPSGRLARAVPVALAVLVVLNVAGWPERRAALESDPPFAEQSRRSALFVRSYRNAYPEPDLDGGYRRFYFECLSTFPRLSARARPQVGEGDGFLRSELREGGLIVRGRRDAQLLAWAPMAGRYRLSATVTLRPDQTLSVLFGSRPPHFLAAVHGEAGAPSERRLNVPLGLASGMSEIRLLSSLDERWVPGDLGENLAAFELRLPVLLLPEGASLVGEHDSRREVDSPRPGR